MITRFHLRAVLSARKTELDNLDRAYMNWVIGDEEYNKKRPILLGRVLELEDLCHVKEHTK